MTSEKDLNTIVLAHKDFLFMVEYAIKAPSGHNSQPWFFKLKEWEIEIHPNYTYRLPVVDEMDRELSISLGCATENICIAASTRGYKTEVNIIDKQYISISLEPTQVEYKDVLTGIEQRQTNRKAYTGEKIDSLTLDRLKATFENTKGIYSHFVEKEHHLFSYLEQMIEEGNSIQLQSESFRKELFGSMRFNCSEVKKTGDGLTYKTFGAPSLPRFISKPIVNMMLTAKRQNKDDIEKVRSSSHLLLLTTENNSFEEWIELGRLLQGFLLQMQKEGLAVAYLNQPCEVVTLAKIMQAEISEIEGQYPTLLLRIGYAKTAAAYSPRRPLASFISQ